MSTSFRLSRLARTISSPKNSPLSPGGWVPSPLSTPNSGTTTDAWDILLGQGTNSFAWDRNDAGWGEGSWVGGLEWAALPLLGDTLMRVGYGSVSFVRPSTTTRTNRLGGTDNLAVNEAPFDWITAPSGEERYSYRGDASNAIFTIPVLRNFRRREGSLSFWFSPNWDAADKTGSNLYLLQGGDWKLYKPSGGNTLVFTVGDIEGGSMSVDTDISAWLSGDWHHILVTWSKTNNRIRIIIDGATADTQSLSTDRIAELGDNWYLGAAEAGGSPAEGYFMDFRSWPMEIPAYTIGILQDIIP